MGLTVLGAVLLITGLLMVLVGEALRLKAGHGGSGIVRVGELVAFLGLAIGVGLTVALTSGRPGRGRADRGPADRARNDRGRADRNRPDRGRGTRRGRVARARRDPAQEWLSPLRTPGIGLVPQRAQPAWQETADQTPPGSDDYSDDGWKLPLDDGWSPGPAYIWAPGEEDWDGQEEGDWDPGEQDWNPSPDGTDWAPGELYGPGAFGPDAPGPQQGHQTGSHGYPNGPAPGYLTGPQPVYAAGPEPEPPGGPAPAYLTDTDAGYVAAADAGYLTTGPDAGPARGPGSAYDPETAYREALAAAVPDLGKTQRDDDTSPIPVIRDQGQPAPQPLASEPAPAKPFSVWEPAPKPNLGSGNDGRSDEVYRPSHAEPPSADTQEKIDQIKDLYLTAEAIGEDALGKHFDELHQRQRSLIREFFDKAGLGPNNTPSMLGDDSAQDGAPLPG